MQRVLILARARLAGEWLGERGARLPVAPVVLLASLSALPCALAREALPPYPYAVLALALTLALTTVPLLGELAPLLRQDPAEEWVGALPARRRDLRLARLVVLGALLGGLALACLLPAALLAPADVGPGARLLLVLAGLAQTAVVAATLLGIQVVLGERGESLLLVLQTALFAGSLIGLLVALGELPALARLSSPSGALLALPPIWFAAVLHTDPFGAARAATWLACVATLAAALALALAPFPAAPRARRTTGALGVLLTPLAVLARRIWVRREEQPVFDLVWNALPAERDFVIRTYPLVAVPLGFLLIGARPGDMHGEGLFALLLFAPATYLPVLLMYVPASATPQARWLLDSAPLDARVEAAGARKALAVRLLTPLYLGLGALVATQLGLEFAVRVGGPAVVAGLLFLRGLWPSYVTRGVFSSPPEELGGAFTGEGSGVIFVGVAATLLGVLVWRQVPTWQIGAGILAAGLAFELLDGRRPARVTRRG